MFVDSELNLSMMMLARRLHCVLHLCNGGRFEQTRATFYPGFAFLFVSMSPSMMCYLCVCVLTWNLNRSYECMNK
jgi:hypothetical protein